MSDDAEEGLESILQPAPPNTEVRQNYAPERDYNTQVYAQLLGLFGWPEAAIVAHRFAEGEAHQPPTKGSPSDPHLQ